MTTKTGFPIIDPNSDFYLGCKKKRANGEPLCNVCPFREEVESQEQNFPKDPDPQQNNELN